MLRTETHVAAIDGARPYERVQVVWVAAAAVNRAQTRALVGGPVLVV